MLRNALALIGVCVFISGAFSTGSVPERGALPRPLVEAAADDAFVQGMTAEENFPAGWYFSAAANASRRLGIASWRR